MILAIQQSFRKRFEKNKADPNPKHFYLKRKKDFVHKNNFLLPTPLTYGNLNYKRIPNSGKASLRGIPKNCSSFQLQNTFLVQDKALSVKGVMPPTSQANMLSIFPSLSG